MRDSDLVRFFEDGTKLKKLSEITLPLESSAVGYRITKEETREETP